MAVTAPRRRRRKQPPPPVRLDAGSPEAIAVVRAFVRQQERVRLRAVEMREIQRKYERARRRPIL